MYECVAVMFFCAAKKAKVLMKGESDRMNEYHDMYDRMAKRCLMLSNRAIIQFINGIYEVNHPLDSEVTYNWTEHEDDDLRKTLADTIITIGGVSSYHLEFQMSEDGSITFRILEYGFNHAIKKQKDEAVLEFPEPILICLYEAKAVPAEKTLEIRFGNKGIYHYKVPVIKYLALSQEELHQKNMIILIPFQLLKLRKEIEKERTEENLKALKYLVTHDIINSIAMNVEAGNITPTDGRKLKSLTLQLYHHIYDKYQEVADEGVSEAVEEALILDIDIIELEHKKEMKKKQEEVDALKLLLQGKSQEEAAEVLHISMERMEEIMKS